MHTKTLNIDSCGRNHIPTKVHRLCRNSIQATLCAFRGERCGNPQSLEAHTSSLARTWFRANKDSCAETEDTSAKRMSYPRCSFHPLGRPTADQLLTATSVSAPHKREVPAAPPEPVDTQTTQMTHDRVTRSGRVVKTPCQIPMNSLAYTVL